MRTQQKVLRTLFDEGLEHVLDMRSTTLELEQSLDEILKNSRAFVHSTKELMGRSSFLCRFESSFRSQCTKGSASKDVLLYIAYSWREFEEVLRMFARKVLKSSKSTSNMLRARKFLILSRLDKANQLFEDTLEL